MKTNNQEHLTGVTQKFSFWKKFLTSSKRNNVSKNYSAEEERNILKTVGPEGLRVLTFMKNNSGYKITIQNSEGK